MHIPGGRLIPDYPAEDRDKPHGLIMLSDDAKQPWVARELSRLAHQSGMVLITTTGTGRFLGEHRLDTRNIKALHGVDPEDGGLTASLSYEVAVSTLFRSDNPKHMKRLEELGLPKFDFIVDLFYAYNGETEDFAKKIDVGGPTEAHAAAKSDSLIITRLSDLKAAVGWYLTPPEERDPAFLRRMVAQGHFDAGMHIGAAGEARSEGRFRVLGLEANDQELCYGENKNQAARTYRRSRGGDSNEKDELAISNFRLDENCMAPSAINIFDLSRMTFMLCYFARAVQLNKAHNVPHLVFIVKHDNACGAAWSLTSPEDALRKAIEGDPVAAFGGAVLTNFIITSEMVDLLHSHCTGKVKRTIDVIAAPHYDDDARAQLTSRKEGKCRVFDNYALKMPDATQRLREYQQLVSIFGDEYIEETYYPNPLVFNGPDVIWYVPMGSALPEFDPKDNHWGDKVNAWKSSLLDYILVDTLRTGLNSNTVLLVDDHKLIGAGCAQPSRIGAFRLAVANAREAGHDPAGSLLGSDSFFPFDDAINLAVEVGVRGILTTSGSTRGDDPTIAGCQANGIELCMPPDTVGRRFSWHR